MKINKDKILNTILVLVLIVVLTALNDKNSSYERVVNALKNADLKNQKFEQEIKDKGDVIAYQTQTILSKDEAIAAQLLEIKDLKKFKNIASKVAFNTETKIDTVYIPYMDIKDTMGVVLPFFRKPFEYSDNEDWISLKGEANNTGILFNEISVRNDFSVIVADKKNGIFKKSQSVVLIESKNPYTRFKKINNVVIDIDRPFYKKNAFWAAVGAVGMFIIVK